MNPAAWPLVHTKRLLYIFTSLTWRLSLGEVAWGRIWKWTHLKKWVMGDGSSCQFLQLEAYFDNFSTWFSVRLVSKEGELQDRSLLIVEKRREIASSLNFLPHASPPPLPELDQAVLTKDIEHWSGGGALLFLVQLLLFLTREDLHVWVFSSDLICRFFPPSSLGARFSFRLLFRARKTKQWVGGWHSVGEGADHQPHDNFNNN